LLLSDEGVGVHVIRALEEQTERFPDVDLLDLGGGGMSVLHAISGRRKAILVDCALMGEPAGTLRRFAPEEVRTVKALSGFSLHEGDLVRVLELSRELGQAPEEVVIFGIQPANVFPGQELSPALQGRLQEYVDRVAAELGSAATA
jgi:hydrogenase maturation protease